MATNMSNNFQAGNIVRYGKGVSALMRLVSPHAGGWHGEHVLGGTQFSSDGIFNKIRPADEADIEFCKKNRPEWFKPKAKSVLQNWVMELPLREQGTLLTGVRGCDLAPKVLDCIDERYGCSTGKGSPERQLVAFLRYCTMNPADEREIDIKGAFFQSHPPTNWKPSQFGHYPEHWYAHIMHCFEVIGYRHPNGGLASQAFKIYERLVKNLHLNVETKEQMIERLSEDRIANGTVVS